MVLVFWLPEITQGFMNVSGANVASKTPPKLSFELITQVWESLWAASWAMVLANDRTLAAIAVALLPLAGLVLLSLRSSCARIIVGLTVAWFAVLIIALTAIGISFHARYMVTTAPLITIAAAAGLTNTLRNRKRVMVAAGSLAVLAVSTSWMLLPGRNEPAFQHDQVREMASYYAEKLEPQDIVLTWSYARRHELAYYWQQLGIQAQLVTLPDGSDAEEVVTIINSYTRPGQTIRAEINTWFTQPGDRRGMLACLLGDNQPEPLEQMTVHGMTTTTYNLAGPLSAPIYEPVSAPLDFGILSVSGVDHGPASASASSGFCLPVDIALSQSTARDYRASIRIINPLGQEIARSDPYILNESQSPTSRLTPGSHAEAFALLYLPAGTPSGTYPVELRIYSEAQPDGLDLLDPYSGAPTGKDARIALLAVEEGQWQPQDEGCIEEILPNITLTNCDAIPEETTLSAGDTLSLTFRWHLADDPMPITVALQGDNWESANTSIPAAGGLVLDWRQITIPADASGSAVLLIQAGDAEPKTLAHYTVAPPEHQMNAPEVQTQTDANFPGFGSVYGLMLQDRNVKNGEPVPVSLVWKAEAASSTPHTVTVQILTEDGTLLAQHDAPPAGGLRPTTGWVAGEYITEQHTLTWREETRDYTGGASLIVALYDPVTGSRVAATSGNLHATLIQNLQVMAP